MFCLHTVKCKNSPISNNSVQHKYSVLLTHQLNVKTVSIRTQFKSQTILFDPLIGFYQMLLLQGQSGPGSDDNKGVLCIPSKLQHYWSLIIRAFSVISRILVEGCLILVQRCSWCILQLLLTEPFLFDFIRKINK